MKAILKIKSIVTSFSRKKAENKKPKLTGKEFNMWEHNGWGDTIYWRNFNERTMHGHSPSDIKVGDVINAKMQSGKVAQFVVVKIEYMRDPSDQFFCTVSDLGYKE